MGNQLYSGPRALSFMSALCHPTRAARAGTPVLAFVLSALMGVAFVALADKTHHLLANAGFATFEEQAVVGTWQGKWQGLPALTVAIDRHGDKLSGIVVLQAVRQTENGPKLAGAPVTLPLREARFDGKTLHFKLDDQRAAQELRDAGIEMTLTSDDQAELRIASTRHDGYGQDESVTMIKQT